MYKLIRQNKSCGQGRNEDVRRRRRGKEPRSVCQSSADNKCREIKKESGGGGGGAHHLV